MDLKTRFFKQTYIFFAFLRHLGLHHTLYRVLKAVCSRHVKSDVFHNKSCWARHGTLQFQTLSLSLI